MYGCLVRFQRDTLSILSPNECLVIIDKFVLIEIRIFPSESKPLQSGFRSQIAKLA